MLGLLGDEEISSRPDEVPDVLAGLLSTASTQPKEIGMNRSKTETGSNEIVAPDLASPRFKANPYPLYARLRDEAPVWRTTLPDKRAAWLVTASRTWPEC